MIRQPRGVVAKWEHIAEHILLKLMNCTYSLRHALTRQTTGLISSLSLSTVTLPRLPMRLYMSFPIS